MKRLAALLVAAGMVLGAIYLRDRIDDDGASTGGSELRMRCSTDLVRVCDQLAEGRDDLEVTVEEPGATADRLAQLAAGEDPGFDLWLGDVSWTGIVDDNRSRERRQGDVLGEPSEVLARSPVVLAVRTNPPPEVREACAEGVTWPCVGDAVGRGASLGLPAPLRGDGLVVLAAAVASWLGTTDYATNDFEEPGFGSWFDAVSAPVGGPAVGDRTPLEAGVTAQGQFPLVGALEADMVRVARSRQVYEAIYPEPVVTSDLVLAPAQEFSVDEGIDRLGGAERIGDVLSGAGWRVPGRGLPEGTDGAPALPEEQGTPAPGVLQALRDRWED